MESNKFSLVQVWQHAGRQRIAIYTTQMTSGYGICTSGSFVDILIHRAAAYKLIFHSKEVRLALPK